MARRVVAITPRGPASLFGAADVPLVLVDRRMRGLPSRTTAPFSWA
ncbi:hypothetical protein [Saccharopolyspora hattusasensis]